jgi:hypothetical protein
MNFHNIPQNTDEWFQLRVGKITASNFGTIMANEGKAFGEPAKRYASRIAVESILGSKLPDYQNDFMIRGTEFEDQARYQYEQENLVTVLPGGFMEGDGYGGSADGIVSLVGLVEIKTTIYSTHFERWKNKDYDSAYQWQIQGNIWLYGAKWLDFISFCPEFPANKRIYVFRVEREEEKIKRLVSRLNEFKLLVNEYKKVIE